jgi:hypothetical protein
VQEQDACHAEKPSAAPTAECSVDEATVNVNAQSNKSLYLIKRRWCGAQNGRAETQALSSATWQFTDSLKQAKQCVQAQRSV